MDKEDKCMRCTFFGKFQSSIEGKCRRYPPKVIPETDSDIHADITGNVLITDSVTHWPIVNGEKDWCGEFKKER